MSRSGVTRGPFVSPRHAARVGHGLNRLEQAIMDRSDAGMRDRAIAIELNVSVERVRKIVNLYRVTLKDQFAADARSGSAALLDAIRALQLRMGASA